MIRARPVRRSMGAMPLVSQVTESVYSVQRKLYLSCSYVVSRPKGVILVDAGIDETAGDMLAGLEAAGRTVDDVRAILITHWHNDHSAGAARIKELSAAQVYYHEQSAPKLTRASSARGLRRLAARLTPPFGPFRPLKSVLDAAPPFPVSADEFVQEGDLIAGEFRVYETPGHEAGHVSFLFEPEGVLFTGDALAICGDRVSFMSRYLTQDVELARASMLRCLALQPRAICPGHRHPLVDIESEHLETMAEYVRGLARWPVFGA